ncbi:MAG: hypothetical protein ACLR6J_13935 [Parabacteroides merdae]
MPPLNQLPMPTSDLSLATRTPMTKLLQAPLDERGDVYFHLLPIIIFLPLHVFVYRTTKYRIKIIRSFVLSDPCKAASPEDDPLPKKGISGHERRSRRLRSITATWNRPRYGRGQEPFFLKIQKFLDLPAGHDRYVTCVKGPRSVTQTITRFHIGQVGDTQEVPKGYVAVGGNAASSRIMDPLRRRPYGHWKRLW